MTNLDPLPNETVYKYKANDPYYFEVDNKPLDELEANDNHLQNTLQTVMDEAESKIKEAEVDAKISAQYLTTQNWVNTNFFDLNELFEGQKMGLLDPRTSTSVYTTEEIEWDPTNFTDGNLFTQFLRTYIVDPANLPVDSSNNAWAWESGGTLLDFFYDQQTVDSKIGVAGNVTQDQLHAMTTRAYSNTPPAQGNPFMTKADHTYRIPDNIEDALQNADGPTALNPFATVSDIVKDTPVFNGFFPGLVGTAYTDCGLAVNKWNVWRSIFFHSSDPAHPLVIGPMAAGTYRAEVMFHFEIDDLIPGLQDMEYVRYRFRAGFTKGGYTKVTGTAGQYLDSVPGGAAGHFLPSDPPSTANYPHMFGNDRVFGVESSPIGTDGTVFIGDLRALNGFQTDQSDLATPSFDYKGGHAVDTPGRYYSGGALSHWKESRNFSLLFEGKAGYNTAVQVDGMSSFGWMNRVPLWLKPDGPITMYFKVEGEQDPVWFDVFASWEDWGNNQGSAKGLAVRNVTINIERVG